MMASSKPFVVSSVSTKRYAPAKKTPVKKQPPIPPPTSTEKRLSVRRGAPTKQTSRHASVPSVVPKTESRRPSSRLMSMPAPDKVAKAQRSLPVHLVPSADRSFPEKTFVPRALKVVQRLKEGKLMGGLPAPVPPIRRSTQVTIANELPPRPSCVPRCRSYPASVAVMEDSKGKQDFTVKVSITGPCNPGTARQKASVNIGVTKTAGRVNATEISVKKPVVAGDCRTGAPAGNWRLTPPNPIVYYQPTSDATWSPPPSPDLSSFPSQSWTMVANVDVEQIKTPTTIWGDETFSSIGDARKSLSSASPTVIQTLASPSEPTVESDGMAKISSPTNGPLAEVLHAVSAATIISPSRNGTASMDALAKVMHKSQGASPTELLDTGNSTLMMVRSAINELSRSLFPSSPRASESSTEVTVPKSMGTNVSRIRKLFAPPLDEGTKASKDPMTQMEIEMLRARKKVAGGGVVDPRLDRLGSLAAMAIVTKLGTSGSDVPGQL